MSRTKLPDRRLNQTLHLEVTLDGATKNILITVGFEVTRVEGVRRYLPREVFCADWKAGTSLHSLIMDTCILLSRCLQHGDTPEELVVSMCTPPSLIGQIAKAVEGPWHWSDDR